MKLHPIFASGMVLPANKPLRLGGEGEGLLCVDFLSKHYEKRVRGTWDVTLDEADYGGPYEMTVSLDGDVQTLTDIYIGEVYLCAGQSNMGFTVGSEIEHPVTTESDPLVRTFVADRPGNLLDPDHGFDTRDGWVALTKENASVWSCISYHVGVTMRRKKGVAIGLVGAYQGASNIQAFLSEDYLTPDIFVPIEKRHGDARLSPFTLWNKDACIYRCTVAPLLPYPLTAAIWYQGESNTSMAEATIYDKMLLQLIRCLRDKFKCDRLPFIVVQICDFDERDAEDWHLLQQKQLDVQNEIDGVVTVTVSDVAEHREIHPQNKAALCEKICKLL